GRALLWAGNDQKIHITELSTGKETSRTEKAAVNAPIVGLTPAPDGESVADARIRADRPEVRLEIWSLESGKRRHAIVAEDTREAAFLQRFGAVVAQSRRLAGARAFSPDGTTLAVGLGDSSAVRLFDVAAGRETGNVAEGHRSAVEAAGIAPGGDRIYTFARA